MVAASLLSDERRFSRARSHLVALDIEPSPSRVVQAVKAGALDYRAPPLKPSRLPASVSRISEEAAEVAARRRHAIAARQRLGKLSGREQQVLEALADGGSNKEIARAVQISPCTVEIHRANLMIKFGAKHAVEAVRIRLDARTA